jgi:hypothetical protein
MLRGLVVLLLLANALFFAWTRDWLAPYWPAPVRANREPERSAAQLRPEIIQILSPKAAGAALQAAKAASIAAGQGDVCLEIGPFDETQAGAAETALAQADLPPGAWARREVQERAVWAVYVGRFESEQVLRTRAEDLRRAGIEGEEIRRPPELAPGLVLGRHETREAAETMLPRWAERGARGAKVVQLSGSPKQVFLRVERADAELAAKLRSLSAPALAVGFGACRR